MMNPQKIISLSQRYQEELTALGVRKKRMDPSRSFASLTRDEVLAHALHLCDNVSEFVVDPAKAGKSHRHFASLQLCLSFAGLYTLEELMHHNKP